MREHYKDVDPIMSMSPQAPEWIHIQLYPCLSAFRLSGQVAATIAD